MARAKQERARGGTRKICSVGRFDCVLYSQIPFNRVSDKAGRPSPSHNRLSVRNTLNSHLEEVRL